MNQRFLLIVLALFSGKIYCQNVTLLLPEQNLLYRHHNNIIHPEVEKGMNYWLESDDTSTYIDRLGPDEYIVRPGIASAKVIRIVVKARIGGDTTTVYTQAFRVTRLPNPNIYWGVFQVLPASDIQDIETGKLIGMGTFFAKYPPEIPIRASFEVTKVVFRIGDKQVVNEGKHLNDMTKRLLREAPKGTLILIESVEISGAESSRTLRGAYTEVH
jgi:hypothetical protein